MASHRTETSIDYQVAHIIFYPLKIETHTLWLSLCLVIWVLLQVISDTVITNMMASLRNLRVLALCYCLGDISISSFNFSMPNLKKLQLERVTPWMTNNDLAILTQNCASLVELSLLGCKLLNSGKEFLFVKYIIYTLLHKLVVLLGSSYSCFMI